MSNQRSVKDNDTVNLDCNGDDNNNNHNRYSSEWARTLRTRGRAMASPDGWWNQALRKWRAASAATDERHRRRKVGLDLCRGRLWFGRFGGSISRVHGSVANVIPCLCGDDRDRLVASRAGDVDCSVDSVMVYGGVVHTIETIGLLCRTFTISL